MIVNTELSDLGLKLLLNPNDVSKFRKAVIFSLLATLAFSNNEWNLQFDHYKIFISTDMYYSLVLKLLLLYLIVI